MESNKNKTYQKNIQNTGKNLTMRTEKWKTDLKFVEGENVVSDK